ncbi:hypothetical protein C1H46_017678 [Malus baccata]|uniref:Uncharacterized protein n=1 Tax=Malus baccata TaxID=106549 RepID=A0A540MD47_MALBA|nr:hypothetical protein C1H46_017678 [Malus baccata]
MWDFVGPERKLLNCEDRIIRGKTMLAYINHSAAYTYFCLQTPWMKRAGLIGTAC